MDWNTVWIASIPVATIRAAKEIKNVIILQSQNEKSYYSKDKTGSSFLRGLTGSSTLEAKS